MNVNSVFLDVDSLANTGNMYGIVSGMTGQPNYMRFTEQYVNKAMLVDELQNRLNIQAQVLCELPPDADRTADTAAWQMLKSILDEVKAL